MENKVFVYEGKEYIRKERLTVKERHDMAYDLLAMGYVIDESKGVICPSQDFWMAERLLAMKYFYGVDVDALIDDDQRFAFIEYCEEAGIDWRDELHGGYQRDAEDIMYYIVRRLEDEFRARSNIGLKLMQTFGSILTGEDIVHEASKVQDLNEKMLDMFEKIRNTDEEKQNDVSRGSVLNFAKKNK